MHGLIFETSIWLLAGSTRYLSCASSTPARPSVKNRRRPSTTPSSRQRHSYSDSVISHTTLAPKDFSSHRDSSSREREKWFVSLLSLSTTTTQRFILLAFRSPVAGPKTRTKSSIVLTSTLQLLTDTVAPDVVKRALSFNRFELSFTCYSPYRTLTVYIIDETHLSLATAFVCLCEWAEIDSLWLN